MTKHFQFLHIQVLLNNDKSWFFTPVYTSPIGDRRMELWNELCGIVASMQESWLVAGDFNDIDSQNEKVVLLLLNVNATS